MWQRFWHRSTPSYITVVSGLPRSGTSMMMRMLAAGGMEVVVDQHRQPDADNPHGYYEFEPVKHLQNDASFLDQASGKAIKILSLLLYDLPPHRQYKILFMQRPMQEVLASQRRMLTRHHHPVQQDDHDMAARFTQHLQEVTTWLQQQTHMQVRYLTYQEILAEPRASASTIRQFLDGRLKVTPMVSVINHALYRNRGSAL